MKKLTIMILASLIVGVFAFVVPAAAADFFDCTGMTKAQCDSLKEDNLSPGGDLISNVIQTLFYIIGAISIIMIIFGGIQYVTSQGESAATAKAKNTILYSVIGLVVALLASVIVAFVNQQFG